MTTDDDRGFPPPSIRRLVPAAPRVLEEEGVSLFVEREAVEGGEEGQPRAPGIERAEDRVGA